MVHVRFFELPLNFELVTCHVELKSRVGHGLPSWLVHQALLLGLVDAGNFGQTDALQVLDLVLVLPNERIWKGQLLDAVSLLLHEQLVNSEVKLLKFQLLLRLHCILDRRVLTVRGHDVLRFIISCNTMAARRSYKRFLGCR